MRTPSAGTPVGIGTLISATAGFSGVDRFERDLTAYLDATHVRATGSGTSALYAILRVLARRSGGREVVMPAYTAPSLVLPIRKAGLSPVLAETSIDTLNADTEALLERVSDQTLAVMPVHMYGLATDTRELKAALEGTDVTVVEDACSSQGTTIYGRQSGTWGDVGFYSFNRGKNMATLSGGAYSTDDPDLAREIDQALAEYPVPDLATRIRNTAFAWGLAAAVTPLGYTALYPLAARFKYTDLHTDFAVRQYTGFQARLGRRLLARFDRIAEARRENSTYLTDRLSQHPGVHLPRVLESSLPVHNQYPVLLPTSEIRTAIHEKIVATGLEATLLYPDPVHRIYDEIWDGAGPDPYPAATEISQRLLLIPVHPHVARPVLSEAADIILTELESARPVDLKEAHA